MRTLKRTYALPSATLDRFEKSVGAGKRSALVAELITEWLDEQEREALRRDIIEGCADMWDVYLEIAQAYEPLEEEVARAFYAQS